MVSNRDNPSSAFGARTTSRPCHPAAPDIIAQLAGTEWQVEFANERFEIIEFKTAMCFLWVMDDVRRQIRRYQEAVKQGDCTLQFKIHVEVNDGDVMQPSVVRQLLNGLMKKE